MTAQILFRATRLMQVCVPKEWDDEAVRAYATDNEFDLRPWVVMLGCRRDECGMIKGNVHIALEV